MEDEYFPPQKRTCAAQLRFLSPLVQASEVAPITSGDGGKSEESLMSSGHVADVAGEDITVTPMGHNEEGTDEGPPENEGGPSVPCVPWTPPPQALRRSQRIRPSASNSRYLAGDLDLPPLNQVSRVDTRMSMEGKVEYVLRALGRAAKRRESIAALQAGWPNDVINKSSLVSVLVLPWFNAHLILAYRTLFRTTYPVAQNSFRIHPQT